MCPFNNVNACRWFIEMQKAEQGEVKAANFKEKHVECLGFFRRQPAKLLH